MKDFKMTSAWLDNADACSDATVWFNQRFPKGAKATEVLIAASNGGHTDWIDWIWDNSSNFLDANGKTVILTRILDALAAALIKSRSKPNAERLLAVIEALADVMRALKNGGGDASRLSADALFYVATSVGQVFYPGEAHDQAVKARRRAIQIMFGVKQS